MESLAILRRAVSVARILLGVVALVLGVKNLLDPEFLYGGAYLHLNEFGQPFPFYRRVLARMEYQQTLLAYAISVCEILLGLSYLTGTIVSLASVGAAFLLVNFAVATAAGNILWLLALLALAVVFLAMGYVGAGLHWGVDGWLVERVNEATVLMPLRRRLPRW
jgi:uncharacterized membrane protein YphA (DoxX/SURF4 family)